ncbi:MAG: hypothetical protein ACLQA5_15135 [Solirubrobacteraceae bacterium]
MVWFVVLAPVVGGLIYGPLSPTTRLTMTLVANHSSGFAPANAF